MDRTQHNPSYRTLSVTSGLGPVALRYLRTCTRVHDNESCRPAHLPKLHVSVHKYGGKAKFSAKTEE